MSWNAAAHESWEMSELDRHLDGEEAEWPPVYMDSFDRYHDTDTGRFISPVEGEYILKVFTRRVGKDHAEAGTRALRSYQYNHKQTALVAG